MAELGAPARAEMVRPVGLPGMLQVVLVVWALLAALAVPAGVPRFRQMAAQAVLARAVLAVVAVMRRAATPAV